MAVAGTGSAEACNLARCYRFRNGMCNRASPDIPAGLCALKEQGRYDSPIQFDHDVAAVGFSSTSITAGRSPPSCQVGSSRQ